MSPRRATQRRYWDACAFIGLLTPEPDKVDACRTVMKAAKEGRVRIVTSAVTLAEVVKLKGKPRLKRDSETRINQFFLHEYITLVDVTRKIAENARQLMWDHEGLWHKDAIHVATALRMKVDQLDTFDDELLKLSGTLGSPPLVIGKPDLPEQLSFEDEEVGDGEDEEAEDIDEEG